MANTAAPAVPAPEMVGQSRTAREVEASALGRMSARFWCEFMFFWTEHWPWFVRVSRGFFLWFAWRYATGMRRGLEANARRLLGKDAGHRAHLVLARNVLNNFYDTIYELGKAIRQSRATLAARTTEIVGADRYDEVRREKRGAIVVTAHLGPFEIGAAALIEKEKRIHMIYQKDVSSRFDRLRSMLRTRLGIMEVSVDTGWSMWIKLRDALQADEVVIIQADRVMPGQKGIVVPFFDGHLCMPTGPFKLALAANAPIIPIFSMPDPNHSGCLRLVIEEPIDVAAAMRETQGQRCQSSSVFFDVMARLASVMERHIQANPAQWMMLEAAWCEDQDEARNGSQSSS